MQALYSILIKKIQIYKKYNLLILFLLDFFEILCYTNLCDFICACALFYCAHAEMPGGKDVNVLHMRYAVEVARLGSLNKVAETLLVAQPNISRSIKDLEADLGITIFRRTSKGMILTEEGEKFIRYAENILKEIDAVERLYKDGASGKRRFSVSAPHADYISDAFVSIFLAFSEDASEFIYKEASLQNTLNGVCAGDFGIGIVRYPSEQDALYQKLFAEKKLVSETIAELPYVVVMNRAHPLAEKNAVDISELESYPEVVYTDITASELPSHKRIRISDRAAQFSLLFKSDCAFAKSTPVSKALLDKYGLVQKICINAGVCKDVLIYRESYRLTEADLRFVSELRRTSQETGK